MMDALEQARREIDTVDAQLAALFERRMKAVLSVAEYKKAHGLPIFDAAREKVVLDKAEARIGDPALRPYYRDHVQNMMDVAKQYEAEVLGRNRAAYQGVEGAFAHIALRALFPHAEAVSCPTWDEVFDAVEKGDAAHGVVPFENSHAGDVSAVLDLCYNHPGLWVVDVYDLPISQNLLVLPGTQLSDLTRVYSHQQAIAQSETFLKQFRLPGDYSCVCSYELLEKAVESAKKRNLKYHVGNILCSDMFYNPPLEPTGTTWAKRSCISGPRPFPTLRRSSPECYWISMSKGSAPCCIRSMSANNTLPTAATMRCRSTTTVSPT